MKKAYLLFILALLPFVANAAVEIDGIYYNLTSGDTPTATVTSNPDKYSGDVVIPASVTYNEVTYSVTSIGESVFYGCSGLTSVTIPNSVTSIGGYAFYDCSGLTSVTIPNSVTSIGSYAFRECSCLTSVHISDIAAWCNISFNDPYSNPLYYAHHLYLNGEEVLDLVIPNSVTSIGDYAFLGCSGLISVTIPNSVTSIGNSAFSGCSGLTSVTIPNSVTSIGEGTFEGCSGLTSVTIPNSVTSIGEGAFYYCSGLTSVTIPNSVTSIGNSAFSGCSGLTSVTIPNSVTSIDSYAFDYCSGLTSVTIPNSVTSIGSYAFSRCSGLIAVDIPNNLKIIKKGTFYGCSSLESVIIPSSVEYIYKEAFANCSKLASVKSLAEAPPFLYDNSFSNFEIPLFVPEASIDSYKAANGWKNFTNVLSVDAAKHKLTYKVDGEVYATYELYEGELITPEPAPTREGYEFSGWSTIPPTMPAEDLTITGTFTLITDYDEIKITSAGQTTWCSKYDLDFTEEESLKVYTATGYKRSTGTIWLSRVKEVPAGEGILIMGDEGVYKIPHRSTTAYYANLMVGTVVAMTLNETDGEYTNYYLSNGKEGVGFYKVDGSVKLGAHRAYLPLKKGTSGNANTRYIGLSFDDGTTDLRESMNNGSDEPDVYYNLQGQRVDNPTKGLYIKNGKKVVVK